MREDRTVMITGVVTNIVDGDTIDIKVTKVDPLNRHTYREIERIRIYGHDAPELGTPGSLEEKEALEKELLGKKLIFWTRLRDKNGRIVAKIIDREKV